MRTIMGMGRGTAATWPTKKRVKKKAMIVEGEKNMVAGKRMDERICGWGLLEGRGDNRCGLGRTCGQRTDEKMKESGNGGVRKRREEDSADLREVGGKREGGRERADRRLVLYSAGRSLPVGPGQGHRNGC